MPPLALALQGSSSSPKEGGTENLSGLECRRLHPSFLVIPEGLLDVHPTEDETC